MKLLLSLCLLILVGCQGVKETQIDPVEDDLKVEENQPITEPKIDETIEELVMNYVIVDTGQTTFFDNQKEVLLDKSFNGQDASFDGNQPSYIDNGDGTITDLNTGLMWQQGFYKSDYNDAESISMSASIGGYDDWRVPTIKELYSLILFTGNQGMGSPESKTPPDDAVPFIDTNYFEFEYPSENRYIDAQYITSTEYVSYTMNNAETFFGVNFADGRIKGYPLFDPKQSDDRYYLRLVRGNEEYGVNNFIDNGDQTISDLSTGLMWMKDDSGMFNLTSFTNTDGSLNWEEALIFANTMNFAGYDDWRLPNAKELHSIVDYTRSPDTTSSPAINEIFNSTTIINEAGDKDFAQYWSSTSFEPGKDAVYFSFGRGLGYFSIQGKQSEFMDVHGAGSQRTDPKIGTPSYGNGPQGDVRRIYNYVRLVRDY
jgi:hypothetical protein